MTRFVLFHPYRWQVQQSKAAVCCCHHMKRCMVALYIMHAPTVLGKSVPDVN